MNNPQDRIIKKMIDDIVEQNKPYIEKPASSATQDAAPSAPTATHAPTSEDNGILGRKIEYGFSNLRQENAELRKQLDDLLGAVKMLRSDLDQIRLSVQQRNRDGAPAAPMHGGAATPSMGAPQYRKTEADEAYERETGQPAHHEEPASQQARGFAKKDPATDVDISKVFYYGKK